jgi:hypothetical protein
MAKKAKREKKESPEGPTSEAGLLRHGGAQLPLVHVDTYNEELRDPEGFIGDRASNRAFQAMVEDWRERLRRVDDDPFGEAKDVKKKTLDKILVEGNTAEAGLVQSVIEEFAQEFCTVVRRFMRHKEWKDTECIVVGGGLRKSRVGELAIARAAVLLKADGCDIELMPIQHHPDKAGIIGCALLAPSWILKGHDAILGVDIGGSNIRAGLVELHLKDAPDLTKLDVETPDVWCYGDEKHKPTRTGAVKRLAKMLSGLVAEAEKKKLRLAPFIGIGCPGLIQDDGSISTGAQNLPGNWESKSFNLPLALQELIPMIGEYRTVCVMHNDAVVQGLSQAPFMRKAERWGIMTIGTGLGNARFTSMQPVKGRKKGRKSA